jgi:hypothetical protein
VRQEGLGKLNISMTSSGMRDLPACRIVPQPSTLLRAAGSLSFRRHFLASETRKPRHSTNVSKHESGGRSVWLMLACENVCTSYLLAAPCNETGTITVDTSAVVRFKLLCRRLGTNTSSPTFYDAETPLPTSPAEVPVT